MPSIFETNQITLPCSPQPKHLNIRFDGDTHIDAVFSSWKGQHPKKLTPLLRSVTDFETTSTIGTLSKILLMSVSDILMSDQNNSVVIITNPRTNRVADFA